MAEINKKGFRKYLWIFLIFFITLTLGVIFYIAEHAVIATEEAAVMSMKPVKPEVPKERVFKDVAWQGKVHSGTYDLYLAEKPDSDLLVFFPGGYWQQHNKRHFAHIGGLAVKNGLSAVIIQMPVFPGLVSRMFYSKDELRKIGFRYSQQFLEEFFRALLNQLIEKEINITRLHLMGYDSGGFYAFMTAFNESTLGVIKKRIKSVITLSAILDLENTEPDFNNRYIEPFFGSSQTVLQTESPVNFTIKRKIPVLQMTAQFDMPMVTSASQKMHQKLLAAGIQAKLEVIPQSSHQSIVFKLGRKSHPATALIEDWLKNI